MSLGIILDARLITTISTTTKQMVISLIPSSAGRLLVTGSWLKYQIRILAAPSAIDRGDPLFLLILHYDLVILPPVAWHHSLKSN